MRSSRQKNRRGSYKSTISIAVVRLLDVKKRLEKKAATRFSQIFSKTGYI